MTFAKAFFSFVDITHGKIEIDGKGGSEWFECSEDTVLYLYSICTLREGRQC